MAAAILSSFMRLRLCHSSQSTLLGRRGMRSRPPFASVSGDEDDVEYDEEKNEEQEIIRAMKKHQKAIQFKRMQREMEPPGPPERRLTWNAIEQIKYLKQEFPEEWTLQRLAVGFNVSTDVIRRVLKSKFIPPEKRKIKQDIAASRVLGQISSGSRHEQVKLVQVKLVASSTDPVQPLLLQGGPERRLLAGQSSQLVPIPKISDSSEIALRTEAAVQRHIAHSLAPIGTAQVRAPTVPRPLEPEPSDPSTENWKEPEESWDGEVLSDHELEKLADTRPENKMNVVQKGSEFFDGDGNFLYRI